MDIKTSKELQSSSKTTTICVGDSRKGKTHFLGTMAEHGKLFVIDCEAGLSSINDQKFDYVVVSNWEECRDALNWFMVEGQKKYNMIGIDSVTRMQSYLKQFLIKMPDGYTEANPNGTGKNIGIMTMSKYDVLATILRKVIDALTKLDNISFHANAMACEDKDAVSGMIKIWPNLQGGMKFDLIGYFDTILYNQMGLDAEGNTAYWTEIVGSDRNCAGTRLKEVKDLYGKVMPNNYGCIVTALKGE